MAVMGSTGIRMMQQEGKWNRGGLKDGVLNTDLHCVSACSLNKRTRFKSGMNLFFACARLKNIDEKTAYKVFLAGEVVDEVTFLDRAKTLQDIF